MTALLTPSGIKAALADARSVYVSGCAAEIAEAPDILAGCPPGATVTGIFSPLLNQRSYANTDADLRVRSFFLTKALKASLADGMVDYCPWRYSVVSAWLAEPSRFDAALIMLSPPDRHGMCSAGVQADFLPDFFGRVGRVYGFINPNMPRTSGHRTIAYRDLAGAVDYDVPLMEMIPRTPDAVSIAIADRIVGLVRERATVQFGIGQIPSQVLARLCSHRGLRIHSGILDDNLLALEAAGALDRSASIVTGTAIGTAALYDVLADARRFAFRPVSYTHAALTLAQIPNFTAINSVLQADLFGQVSAEGAAGRLLASPGGLPDFVRGSLESPGGVSILGLRAGRSASQTSGIVAVLGSPGLATIGAADADILVSEFGVARVRNLNLDARAEAIIGIAAPEDRDGLQQAWRQLRNVGLGAR